MMIIMKEKKLCIRIFLLRESCAVRLKKQKTTSRFQNPKESYTVKRTTAKYTSRTNPVDSSNQRCHALILRKWLIALKIVGHH